MAILNSPLQFISSIPPAARGFTLALVLASLGRYLLASWFPESPLLLELLPGLVIWRPWTLVTSPFVEVGLIEVRSSSLRMTNSNTNVLDQYCGQCPQLQNFS